MPLRRTRRTEKTEPVALDTAQLDALEAIVKSGHGIALEELGADTETLAGLEQLGMVQTSSNPVLWKRPMVFATDAGKYRVCRS